MGLAEIVENSDFRDKIHVFDDRSHAGEVLAKWLKQYEDREDAIIIAIPAGGVPVAVQVSKKLNIPWDLAVTTKLHIPWNREAGVWSHILGWNCHFEQAPCRFSGFNKWRD